MSQNVKLIIEYRGTAYCGFQRQKNGISVQEKLEEAIECFSARHVSITGAGRTDSGVHAMGQCVSFPYDGSVPVNKLTEALNTRLPMDIRVLSSDAVPDDFNARFSARGKRYEYRFLNRRAASAFADTTWHVPGHLDRGAMHRAAQDYKGTHDWTAFMAAGGQTSTTVRTVWDSTVSETGDLITFTVSGNGFLYNQVRIMSGTLYYIGLGKLPADAIPAILHSLDRVEAGPTAPAHALTLAEVYY